MIDHAHNSNRGASLRERPAAAIAPAGVRKLIRAHVKACPFKEKGSRHIDCSCPVYLAEYRDHEGKRVPQRSLRTRDWKHACRRLAELEAGAPTETIAGMGKLFRKHGKKCQFRGPGGVGHLDCQCVIWMRGYKPATRKRVAHDFTRSLRTRDWQQALDRLGAIENGAPVEAVKSMGRLYRHHDRDCPFKNQGRHHIDCSCPVYVGSCKDANGKRIPDRSLRTRDWQQAQDRLAAVPDPRDVAHLEKKRLGENRATEVRLKPLLTVMRAASDGNGNCSLTREGIAGVFKLSLDAIGDQLRELVQRGLVTMVRQGRRNVYSVAAVEDASVGVTSESAVPFEAAQVAKIKGKPGRQVSDEAKLAVNFWFTNGKPRRLTDSFIKQAAKRICQDEYAKALRFVKRRRNLFNRIASSIRRSPQYVATKWPSATD